MIRSLVIVELPELEFLSKNVSVKQNCLRPSCLRPVVCQVGNLVELLH